MKYKIVWIESHDPMNWGKTWEQGHTNILNSLPNPEIERIDSKDGWLDVRGTDYFEANNLKQAKKITQAYEVGTSGVFAVFDIKDKMVFTEQDIESEE